MRVFPVGLSRRAGTALALGLVGVAGVTPVLAARSGSDPASTATLAAVAPRPADSVSASYGVVVHLIGDKGVYGDEQRVADVLSDLGARHVRTRMYADRPKLVEALTALHDRGIGADLVMGNPTAVDPPAALVRAVAALPPGTVDSLEGANEWNLSGRPDWVAELRAHQAALWAAAKADPATAALPVLAPALGMDRDYSALGDLSAVSDAGNLHLYPGGRAPSSRLDAALENERAVVGDAPVVATETGYHNALASVEPHVPTPEDVAGTYAPRLVLEHLARGVQRVYTYELFDERPDPAHTDREANFGLVRHDGTTKPAYRTTKALLALTADPGPAFRTAPLDYEVRGATPDVRQLLLQKRDGSYVLLLWRDVPVWDRTTRTPLAVDPVPVTVALGRPADVALRSPSAGTGVLRDERAVRTSTVPLAGDVVALTVAPTPVPGAPTGVTATAGDASATVRWAAPAGGAAPTAYEVTTSPGGRSVRVDGSSRRALVDGLTNGTAYTATVTAYAGEQAGPASAASAPVVPAPLLPAAPTGLAVLPGDGSLQVRWSATGSSADSWRVTATPAGGLPVSTTVAGRLRVAALTGLTNGTTVTVTVAGTNGAGTGPAATATGRPVAPPAVPTGVAAAPLAGGALVSWAPAADVDRWVVTATPSGARAEVPGTATSATLAGLADGVEARVVVTAENAAGSAGSAPVVVRPVPVPAAPASATAWPRAAAAMVRWSPVPAATGYTVTAAPGGATASVEAGATHVVLRGLQDGTAYVVSVVATGTTGSGPAAVTAPVVPLPAPAAPADVTAAPLPGSALVRWTPPAGPVGRYRVVVAPGGATVEVDGDTTSVLVDDLRPGRPYAVAVTAHNISGASRAAQATPVVPAPVRGGVPWWVLER